MPEVLESILLSIKKLNNVAPSDKAFDADLIMYTNAALSDLTQVGIGPSEGFFIEDEESTWDEFLPDDPRLEGSKAYIGMKVRLMFDPPTSGFAIDAIKEQLIERLWRLKLVQETREHEEEVST